MADFFKHRPNVIDLGAYRFTRKNSRSFLPTKGEDCQHKHLTLESHGDIVTCDDCSKQVGAFWALLQMVENWQKWWDEVRTRGQRVVELEQKTVVLRAALRVEKAWRSKTMAPCCPHCNKAILPTDGFGECASVNKEMELARRKRASLSPPGAEK